MAERLTNSCKEIPTLCDNAEYWLQVYFKLKDYEDLEEGGKLIELPCADGDVVYWRNVAGELKKAIICGYNLSAECDDGRGYTIRPEIIGKTVFSTREEAEAALKGAEE